MAPEAVLNELKDKRLPTYGTGQERKERLKKQYGIQPKGKSSGITQSAVSGLTMPDAALLAAQGGNMAPRKPTSTTDKIDQIKINRDVRRLKMEEIRKLKSERETNNQLQGIKVDVDFQAMVEVEKKKLPKPKYHVFAD